MELKSIKSKQRIYYSFFVSVKLGGSFNNIDNPYAWIYVPVKVNNMNAKVFNAVSIWKRFLVQHELSVNVIYMEMCVAQTKNRIMIKAYVNMKNKFIGILVKMGWEWQRI